MDKPVSSTSSLGKKDPKTTTPSTLEPLVFDIYPEVFTFLSLHCNLRVIPCVCKYWKELICEQPDVWSGLVMDLCAIPRSLSSTVDGALTSCGYATEAPAVYFMLRSLLYHLEFGDICCSRKVLGMTELGLNTWEAKRSPVGVSLGCTKGLGFVQGDGDKACKQPIYHGMLSLSGDEAATTTAATTVTTTADETGKKTVCVVTNKLSPALIVGSDGITEQEVRPTSHLQVHVGCGPNSTGFPPFLPLDYAVKRLASSEKNGVFLLYHRDQKCELKVRMPVTGTVPLDKLYPEQKKLALFLTLSTLLMEEGLLTLPPSGKKMVTLLDVLAQEAKDWCPADKIDDLNRWRQQQDSLDNNHTDGDNNEKKKTNSSNDQVSAVVSYLLHIPLSTMVESILDLVGLQCLLKYKALFAVDLWSSDPHIRHTERTLLGKMQKEEKKEAVTTTTKKTTRQEKKKKYK